MMRGSTFHRNAIASMIADIFVDNIDLKTCDILPHRIAFRVDVSRIDTIIVSLERNARPSFC